MKLRVAMVGMVVGASSLAFVPVGAAESADTPIAIMGNAPGLASDAQFEVALWPRDEIQANLRTGESVPTHKLPASAVSVDGSEFSIRMDRADVPKKFLNDDGRVDVDVTVIDTQNRLVGGVSKTVTMLTAKDSGDVAWVDAESPLGQGGGTVATLTAASAPAPARVDVKLGSMPEQSAVGGAATAGTSGACKTSVALVANSDKPAAIAHTFIPDGTKSTARAYHSSTRTHTFGIAATFGNGWQASGSRTYTAGVMASWLNNTDRQRSYRVDVRYGKYKHYRNYQDGDNGTECRLIKTEWKPRRDTGGRTYVTYRPTPTWGQKFCKTVQVQSWRREVQGEHNFALSGGVDLSGLVGFDVRSARGYATNAYIEYNPVGTKKLCGNNDIPAFASSVRMAKTW